MRPIIMALALLAGLMPRAWADDLAALRGLAEQGDALAQYALGSLYRYGQGVARDHAEALRWWQRAAERGLLDAKLALGNIYAGGTGLARDGVQAYMWFELAALQSGDDWLRGIARSNRDAVAARMNSAEIAEARRRAEAWAAEHGG